MLGKVWRESAGAVSNTFASPPGLNRARMESAQTAGSMRKKWTSITRAEAVSESGRCGSCTKKVVIVVAVGRQVHYGVVVVMLLFL